MCCDAGHAREHALGQEFPCDIHHEEAPVIHETKAIDLRRRHGVAAQGFHGIDVEAGDAGHCGRQEGGGEKEEGNSLPRKGTKTR